MSQATEREIDEREEEELPARPRNRLLAPLPLALIAVLVAATGFLGGVLVQKGSEGSSVSGPPGGLPASFPVGDSGAVVSGTVSSVDGRTIYVKDSGGATVAVRVEDGSKISRDSSVGVKKIRPGDSVEVQGSKRGSTVKASSISATESSGDEGGSSDELFGE